MMLTGTASLPRAGGASLLVWSGITHGLPFNQFVCISLLHLCVCMAMTGPVISSLNIRFGQELKVQIVEGSLCLL